MRLLDIIVVAALLMIGLGVAPIAFAQQHKEHPVGQVRCEKLPTASTTEIAKIFADELQEPSVCPAGQFPRRYGTGEDIAGRWKCVKAPPESVYTSRDEPVDDPRIAHSVIEASKRVMACPPDFVVKDTNQTLPPWYNDPTKSPFYRHIIIQPKSGEAQKGDESDSDKRKNNIDPQKDINKPLAAASSPTCTSISGGYYCYVVIAHLTAVVWVGARGCRPSGVSFG
jgi:hypothetical protein